MLRLAVKRNGFFVFFILFVAVIASACGEESSSSVPTASTANCAAYSYTSSSTVSVSPSAGYAYGGIAVPPATITFNDTTVAPAKVTITSGFPPFGVSAQSFASMSLAYAGPYAFGTGFLSITAADAVASTSDPSCMTYVFWVVPEPGAVPAGTYSDMITVTDSKGSTATTTLTITVSKS